MKRFNFFIWFIILAVLITFALLAYDFIGKSTESNTAATNDNATEDNVGTLEQVSKDAAPDFSLKDLNGNTVKLSDYKGKTVVLNFWASWCGPCQEEMPEFEKLNSEFKKNGDVILLTVNLTDGQNETKEKASAFIKDHGYTFTVLLDENQTAASLYYIDRIPQTYIIDRDGNIHDHFIGMITEDKVLSSVNEVK